MGTNNNNCNVFMNDTINEHTRKNGHTRSGECLKEKPIIECRCLGMRSSLLNLSKWGKSLIPKNLKCMFVILKSICNKIYKLWDQRTRRLSSLECVDSLFQSKPQAKMCLLWRKPWELKDSNGDRKVILEITFTLGLTLVLTTFTSPSFWAIMMIKVTNEYQSEDQ